jgi:hypothetical protein
LTRQNKIARNFSGLLPRVHPEKNPRAVIESYWRHSPRFYRLRRVDRIGMRLTAR